jgi:hypothetical protein
MFICLIRVIRFLSLQMNKNVMSRWMQRRDDATAMIAQRAAKEKPVMTSFKKWK